MNVKHFEALGAHLPQVDRAVVPTKIPQLHLSIQARVMSSAAGGAHAGEATHLAEKNWPPRNGCQRTFWTQDVCPR